jgi:hypothetical protein
MIKISVDLGTKRSYKHSLGFMEYYTLGIYIISIIYSNPKKKKDDIA